MSLSTDLLAILACPEDKGPLYYLEADELLYNPRLTRAYAVRDGIPVMLVDEATTVDADEHARIMGIIEARGPRSDVRRFLTISRSSRGRSQPMKTTMTQLVPSRSSNLFRRPTPSSITNELRLATMISTTMFRRGAALLLGVTALGIVPAAPTASAAATLGAGGEYFPVAPARIYDEAGINADGSVDVDVVGLAGVPAENVLAVAVNVTDRQRSRPRLRLGQPVRLRGGHDGPDLAHQLPVLRPHRAELRHHRRRNRRCDHRRTGDPAGRRNGACDRRRLRLRGDLVVRRRRGRPGRRWRPHGDRHTEALRRHPRRRRTRPAARRWVPDSRSRCRSAASTPFPTARTSRPSW